MEAPFSTIIAVTAYKVTKIHTFRKQYKDFYYTLQYLKQFFIKYVNIFAVFGVTRLKNACKNARPQRQFRNFTVVQN